MVSPDFVVSIAIFSNSGLSLKPLVYFSPVQKAKKCSSCCSVFGNSTLLIGLTAVFHKVILSFFAFFSSYFREQNLVRERGLWVKHNTMFYLGFAEISILSILNS